jgi:outer membrane protein assembly factor BamB
MRQVAVLVGLAAMGVVCLASAVWAADEPARAAAADWPCWQGSNHDDKSPDKGLLKEWPAGGPKKLWEASGIGSGYSTITVSGDKVYAVGDVGSKLVVSVFDMTGKKVMTFDVDQKWDVGEGQHPGARSSVTVDDGKFYITAPAGLIGCFDAAKGTKIWTKKMQDFGGSIPQWGYAESVLIQGNMAIVTPGGRNCIVALDKATGAQIWASKGFDGGPQYSSVTPFTFGNVQCLVAGTAAGLVCVDAKTGTVLWSQAFAVRNVANCPSPFYSDGYVFWAVGYGKGAICMKLSEAGGKVTAEKAWALPAFDCHHGGYIIDKGYVYGNAGNGWMCLDLKTGTQKWRADGVGKGSLCWADGMLYLFGENGGKAGLATCTTDGLQMKGTFSVKGAGPSWAHPVVIGGRLYLRYDTNLYCYDVKAAS